MIQSGVGAGLFKHVENERSATIKHESSVWFCASNSVGDW